MDMFRFSSAIKRALKTPWNQEEAEEGPHFV